MLASDRLLRELHLNKRVIALALCASLFLAACGSDGGGDEETDTADTPAAAENVVQVDLTEYEFGMPDTVEGGVVTFEASNTGTLPHEMAFGKIEGDHDMDDVMKALDSEQPPSWFSDVAGIPLLSPGLTASMTRDLEEGRYIFLCFLPTPEGGPHAMEGMVKLFEVEGTSDAELPEPDVTVVANADGFEVPEIAAGTHVIEFSNEDSKPHEFAVFSYEEGKTEQDIGKYFNSGFKTEPPAVFPGGMQSIPSGEPVFVEMTFESGRTYTLEDFEAGFSEEIVVE
jgi:hypothetical protein